MKRGIIVLALVWGCGSSGRTSYQLAGPTPAVKCDTASFVVDVTQPQLWTDNFAADRASTCRSPYADRAAPIAPLTSVVAHPAFIFTSGGAVYAVDMTVCKVPPTPVPHFPTRPPGPCP